MSVQHLCTACGHAILLSDFVPADAIDRARLKESVNELREELAQRNAQRQRAAGIFAIVVIVIAMIGVAIAVMVTR